MDTVFWPQDRTYSPLLRALKQKYTEQHIYTPSYQDLSAIPGPRISVAGDYLSRRSFQKQQRCEYIFKTLDWR